MAGASGKQYGLILPSKNKTAALGTRKLNPLIDSDDELEKDEDEPMNWVEASLKKSAGNAGQQSLQRRLLKEALEEDATVFQYDEVYDDMQESKQKEEAAKKDAVEKKPKYIHNILKQAEKRKIEDERRMERKVQKEREEEGDMFADKESFVTASYMKKMDELKKAEIEEKIEQMKEEKNDVLKTKNFGAFYTHLFKQKMGGDSEVKVKEEPELETIKKREFKNKKNIRSHKDTSESPDRERSNPVKQIRRNDSSNSDSDEEIESYRDRLSKREKEKNEKDKSSDRNREKKYDRDRSNDRAADRRSARDNSRERYQRDKQTGRRSKSRDKIPRSRSREGRKRRSSSRSRDRSQRHSRSKSRDRIGRRRSRSREERNRHSRSRSPVNDKRRSGESHQRSKSPHKNIKSKVKEEPNSSSRNEESSKEKNKNESNQENKNPIKIKEEKELEEKEKRLDRIRKLFTKRTVGEKFDQAVERYYQRKAARQAQG